MNSTIFSHSDEFIEHIENDSSIIIDPMLSMKYSGFVSVSAVTVYELAIKDIMISFADSAHVLFGNFTRGFFNKINGRISIESIKSDYVAKFGSEYIDRFRNEVRATESRFLQISGKSPIACYGNIITWRNSFAHEGKLPTTTTLLETIESYRIGKEIILCLDRSMIT